MIKVVTWIARIDGEEVSFIGPDCECKVMDYAANFGEVEDLEQEPDSVQYFNSVEDILEEIPDYVL